MHLADLSNSAFAIVLAALCQGTVMVILRLVAERRWPAEAARPGTDRSNLHAWTIGLLTQFLFSPALGAGVTTLVNRVGGGLIALPSHGWGLLAGVAAYFVAMDFGEFAFHRMQHKLPWLWAWHSLHHSDTSYDTTTTVRHFWLDPFLKSVTVYLAAGLLFKAPAPIPLIYGLLTFYNHVIHSNTRLDFGRWSWLLNAPGYHRLHHSASPEHFDVNFAALLPVFDLLGGSYRPARPGERPATGLDTGDLPASAAEVALWPVRGPLGLRPAPLKQG